jgi:hypothetical protein
MSGDNRRRFQRVDFVKRSNPFQPGLPVRFAEKWVNAVIDNVANVAEIVELRTVGATGADSRTRARSLEWVPANRAITPHAVIQILKRLPIDMKTAPSTIVGFAM